MKILVIGGTGYIGTHAVEELVRRGHEVTVFARGQTPPRLPAEALFIKGNRHHPEDLQTLQQHRFDAVVDINAYTREETQAVINTFDGRVSRFVHLSTFSVCQRTSPLPFTESDPLVTDPSHSYGYNKAECERALRWAHTRNGFPFVSLRPVVVFGPRDDKSRENYYLKRMIAGDPIIVPDGGALPLFAVYVKDLAAVIANALAAEGVAGRAYHLSQHELVSVDDHIAHIGRLAQVVPDVTSIPASLLERLGYNLRVFPYFARGRMVALDTRAARRDLTFQPTPYAKALRETIQYLLERGPERSRSIEDLYPPVMPRQRDRLLVTRFRAAVRELEDRLTDEWLNEAMPRE